MRKILTLVSLAALLASPAMADDTGAAAQIRVVGYSALRRVDVIGLVGQPTTITFPVGEQVFRIVQTGAVGKDGAIGDAGWQGATPEELKAAPLGNNLTLWPARPGQSTMSVITMQPNGEQKVYPFRMIARAADADASEGVTLNLIFKGDAPAVTPPAAVVAGPAKPTVQPTQAAIAAWRATQKEKTEAKLRQTRADAFNPAGETCGFEAHGKTLTTIAPKCPLTDGQWTVFRFPGLSKKPAVYIGTCEDGKDDERLARQHEAGDFVVVEEIAANFCLRLGTDVLDIRNNHYDPAGKPSPSGTVDPDVKRDLIRAVTH